jgi:hypothetical protein
MERSSPGLREMGHDDVVRLLATNLNEVKAANAKLNTVATRKRVNKKTSVAWGGGTPAEQTRAPMRRGLFCFNPDQRDDHGEIFPSKTTSAITRCIRKP